MSTSEISNEINSSDSFASQEQLKINTISTEPIINQDEEITNDNNFRFTIKPLNQKYKIFWDLYKKQQDSYWRAEEIDFSNDKYDFENVLDKDEQHFVKMILAFFASSDGIVNMNLRERFLNEIQITEAQVAYGFQLMMENIHGEVYSDMLTNIIEKPSERDFLINSFKNVNSIKRLSDWAIKWINCKSSSLAKRIVAFAIVEGVFFSGAFASIFWLKKRRSRGKYFMNGLIKSNRFIARDEGLHTNFACVLYSFVNNKLSQSEINEIFDEAIDIASEFTQDAIRCDLIGMNVELMNQYTKYVSDRLIVYLGYEKIYNVTNPFDFMESIGLLNKDNFFEMRVDAYQSAYNQENRKDWKFNVLENF